MAEDAYIESAWAPDDRGWTELHAEYGTIPGPDPSPGPLPPFPPLPGPHPIPWPPRGPWPPRWPWPRRWCLRRQPVSGRYEGTNVLAGPLPLSRSILDLRIDIDNTGINSPAMNRVSADLYTSQPSIWPNPPGRVYQESWIIDAPNVVWRDCDVEITGTVRWWRGTHPSTSARIVIPWNWAAVGPASVTVTEDSGASFTYTCSKRSIALRELEIEIDVCQSVNAAPVVPSYDTHAHNVRPTGVSRRTLTIEQAYREAGVSVTLNPARTVIDDSAAGFASWSPAELHDAMVTNYSSFGDAWPAWRMWGLLAGQFENAGVGGIMFDAAAGFGGAGHAPERQGFAVFRRHQWFNNLPAGVPTTQDEAWALRHFLYTYVHEAGHAFNLLHSWNKNRPDSLSWMNYDWRYDSRNGAGAFWSNFTFRFDDEELIHIRHGDRSSVIMGGDPWASGGHLESTPADAMSQYEGPAPPLELLVRSKSYFEFMEPVFVELRLRNRSAAPLEVDTRLAPEYGAVTILVRRPDGHVERYAPVMCALGIPEARTLAPTGVEDGTDRYSESVFVAYGGEGFLFDAPGEYLVRAVYQGFGDFDLPSNTVRVRVGHPAGPDQEKVADDYFTPEVGLSLYLDGSQSPFLQQGMETLRQVAERFGKTLLGAKAAETVGRGAARPFYRIQDPEEDARLVQVHEADPQQHLDVTSSAVAVYRKEKEPALSLPYHRLVRERATALAAIGETSAAEQELSTLAKDLKARGVNEVVLDDIRDAAKTVKAADQS